MVTQKKQVFLIQCGPGCRGRYRAICRNNAIPFWMYLGKDATRIPDLESLVGPGATRLGIGEELQSTARACRQEYIDFVGKCSDDAAPVEWFRTSLSEKNPFVSDFFVNLCYVRVARSMVSRHEGTICIFCDSPAVMESVRTNLGQLPGITVNVSFNPALPAAAGLLTSVAHLKNRFVFLARYLSRILLARIFCLARPRSAPVSPEQRTVAIHSWADQRSFPGGDRYLDVYFGELGEILAKNDMEPVYIVHVLPTLWYPRALKSLRSTGVRWRLFEEYLGFADIFRAAFRPSCNRGYPASVPLLCGCDVTALVQDESRRDCTGSRSTQSCLWYYAARSLGTRLSLSALFYTFENHIWEKMFIMGLRCSIPHTKLIGYAHATVNPMELSYSHAPSGRPESPLPDMIIVNGIRARETLAGSGFPQDRIAVVGTLRYANAMYVHRDAKPRQRKRILVVLSADFSKSVEMVLVATKAFGPVTGTDIVLKPHPTMKTTALDPYLRDVPPHFSVSTIPFSDSLGSVDLVIYNDSSAAVEVAVNDIPLVHIKSGHSLDINVFEGVSAVPSVSSPEQLRHTCLEILADPRHEVAEVHRYADQFFAPVDADGILSIISRP